MLRKCDAHVGAMTIRFAQSNDTATCPLCSGTNNVSNSSTPEYDSGKEEGILVSSIVVVVLGALGGYTCFFLVKEQMSWACTLTMS